MGTSMAAALAASLPVTQSAPAPAAPQYEEIPASMTSLIDVEAAIPVETIQLDALVCRAIIGRDTPTQLFVYLGRLEDHPTRVDVPSQQHPRPLARS